MFNINHIYISIDYCVEAFRDKIEKIGDDVIGENSEESRPTIFLLIFIKLENLII